MTQSAGRFCNKPAILGGEPAFKTVLPITKPTIPPTGKILKDYGSILESGMLTTSKYVQEFEKKVAAYLGVKHAVAVSSCTSGLMLVMKVLGLTGEIIVPSFTFHATAHAAVWNRLKLVFVDCDSETYNLDLVQTERLITNKTSAIAAVHLFGNPCPVRKLEKLARKHKLKLIFDSAHGFGATFQGKPVGGFGDAEVFSLSPTKLLTSGEGGIVATNSRELAEKIRLGRNYGDPGSNDSEFSGLNARMSEFHARLGIESLRHLDKNVRRRQKMAQLYKSLLKDIPGLSFQKIEKKNQSSFKDLSVFINKKEFGLDRNQLMSALTKENIVVRKYFHPPVHRQKAFAVYRKAEKRLKTTKYITDNVLSLPLFSHISEGEVKQVCFAIKRIYEFRMHITGM